jgi:regulator of CtrA degradation
VRRYLAAMDVHGRRARTRAAPALHAGRFVMMRSSNDQKHGNMVVLTERRVASDRFSATYKRGMALVEETAHYLDGDGRADARQLSKAASMLYASESMRLTTRLMQIASWLLLQRAANAGEMTVSQVMQERTKVRLETPSDALSNPAHDELPEVFRSLVGQSLSMERDIRRLDEELYGDRADALGRAPETNPVSEQIALLRTAFGR